MLRKEIEFAFHEKKMAWEDKTYKSQLNGWFLPASVEENNHHVLIVINRLMTDNIYYVS